MDYDLSIKMLKLKSVTSCIPPAEMSCHARFARKVANAQFFKIKD